MEQVLQTTPYDHGIEETRWRLAHFVGYLPGAGCRSTAWRILRRLGFRYRQGWEHRISPDPWATEKLAWIDLIQQRAKANPEQIVILWLDELTFYRLPTPAPTWCPKHGRAQKARLTQGANTVARIVGALNPLTGQCHYLLRSKVGVQALKLFYAQLRHLYPHAVEIYVIQDCWPVHFLSEVCSSAAQHGITLVPLPTYSSWRNPIEKVWRWLKQTVIHMHPWADDWQRLKSEVAHFLDRFSSPNAALLRYVGLPNYF
jgi:transposase